MGRKQTWRVAFCGDLFNLGTSYVSLIRYGYELSAHLPFNCPRNLLKPSNLYPTPNLAKHPGDDPC